MKNRSLQATVLIYTLFLLNIALILWLVVFNVAWILLDSSNYYNTVRKLSNNILYKSNIALKYDARVNSDGSWYSDSVSCPTTVTMSGRTARSTTVYTALTYSGWIFYCQGAFTWSVGGGSNLLQIFFNDTNFAFTGAIFKSSWVNLVWLTTAVGKSNFIDSDSTLISFSLAWLEGKDKIDDNYNSDNYKVNSTGTTNYPGGYGDNDADARKIIYFYIPPWWGYTNIFWNSPTITTVVANNTNNIDLINQKMWWVTSAKMLLDVDQPYWFQLVKFDKTKYLATKELIPTQIITSTSWAWRIGYIQTDGSIATTWLTPTGSEYNFNYTTDMYGLFLSNQGTQTMLFSLKASTSTGAGIYISPIDDSSNTLIHFLGNDILVDQDNKYIGSEFDVVALKVFASYAGVAGPSCTYGAWLFGYCAF